MNNNNNDKPPEIPPCPFCGKTSISMQARRQHIARKHSEENRNKKKEAEIFLCGNCSKGFSRKNHMYEHQKCCRQQVGKLLGQKRSIAPDNTAQLEEEMTTTQARNQTTTTKQFQSCSPFTEMGNRLMAADGNQSSASSFSSLQISPLCTSTDRRQQSDDPQIALEVSSSVQRGGGGERREIREQGPSTLQEAILTTQIVGIKKGDNDNKVPINDTYAQRRQQLLYQEKLLRLPCRSRGSFKRSFSGLKDYVSFVPKIQCSHNCSHCCSIWKNPRKGEREIILREKFLFAEWENKFLYGQLEERSWKLPSNRSIELSQLASADWTMFTYRSLKDKRAAKQVHAAQQQYKRKQLLEQQHKTQELKQWSSVSDSEDDCSEEVVRQRNPVVAAVRRFAKVHNEDESKQDLCFDVDDLQQHKLSCSSLPQKHHKLVSSWSQPRLLVSLSVEQRLMATSAKVYQSILAEAKKVASILIQPLNDDDDNGSFVLGKQQAQVHIALKIHERTLLCEVLLEIKTARTGMQKLLQKGRRVITAGHDLAKKVCSLWRDELKRQKFRFLNTFFASLICPGTKVNIDLAQFFETEQITHFTKKDLSCLIYSCEDKHQNITRNKPPTSDQQCLRLRRTTIVIKEDISRLNCIFDTISATTATTKRRTSKPDLRLESTAALLEGTIKDIDARREINSFRKILLRTEDNLNLIYDPQVAITRCRREDLIFFSEVKSTIAYCASLYRQQLLLAQPHIKALLDISDKMLRRKCKQRVYCVQAKDFELIVGE